MPFNDHSPYHDNIPGVQSTQKPENINEPKNCNMEKIIQSTNGKLCIFPWGSVNKLHQIKEILYSERYSISWKICPPEYKSCTNGQSLFLSSLVQLPVEVQHCYQSDLGKVFIPRSRPLSSTSHVAMEWKQRIPREDAETIPWTWNDLEMRKHPCQGFKRPYTERPLPKTPRYIKTRSPKASCKET